MLIAQCNCYRMTRPSVLGLVPYFVCSQLQNLENWRLTGESRLTALQTCFCFHWRWQSPLWQIAKQPQLSLWQRQQYYHRETGEAGRLLFHFKVSNKCMIRILTYKCKALLSYSNPAEIIFTYIYFYFSEVVPAIPETQRAVLYTDVYWNL